MNASAVITGLEGIVVAETTLSEVDGQAGRLVVAGADVEQLAEAGDSVSVAERLWSAATGEPADPERGRRELGQARVSAFELLDRLGDALDGADGMAALRTALGHLRLDRDLTPRQQAFFVNGAVTLLAASWKRRQRGLSYLAPDPTLSPAADYLRLLRGEPASHAEVRALDAYWVTVMDHGLNASTFAARVVASTGSDLVSAIVAALGALKGPLHGGAPGPVLDMLDAIGAPERASGWVRAELGRGRRIMGMGHRVYRVRDPRAQVLERALLRLAPELGSGAEQGHRLARLQLARSVEQAAESALAERYPERALRANVEFYTAVLLEALGLDRDQFSATFAAGRVAGWVAHVEEQRRTGRLIRPSSRYVGQRPSASEGAL